MIKHLSKAFESLCDILAIVNLLISSAIFFLAAFIITRYFTWDTTKALIFGGLGACLGLLIGYVADIITFGLFAQIIEIRKLLENKEQ